MEYVAKKSLNFIIIAIIVLGSCQGMVKQETQKAKPNKIMARQESFVHFLVRFKGDSAFQKSHIRFPLRSLAIDVNNEVDTSIVKSTEWKYTNFDGYILKINKLNSDTTMLMIGEEDTGLSVRYNFIPYNDSWILVEMEDDSD